MDYKKEILENGYCIINNIFSVEEINNFRKKIIYFKAKNKLIENLDGYTIPNFMIYDDLQDIYEIKNNNKILNILEDIFNGKKYRFCGHHDIGINRIVGWHKDKLNGIYSKYETENIWNTVNGENHEIVKVLVYLQDHEYNNDGLKLVPKSHKIKDIISEKYIQLHPKIGDIIIFDQRITHRGMDKQSENIRILVSFGFGKNNIFTDNFEKGTIARQNDQNKNNM
jgi:ectoine hydroxylase-related dioxygenase (phytanoyl-CoA dioxygenase family)